MRRALASTLATGLLIAPLATAHPAAAGSVMRGVYVEEFDATTAFGVGENACVDYAGTEHEVRSGSYALMAPGMGPRSAELKVRGAIDGFIEITPTNPADGPSYAGTYSERVVGWLTDPDTDTFRVAHFRLHGRLAGSDGTSAVFESTFKVTMKPDGTAVVDRLSSTCG
jgi:hypothetical protein